MTAEFQKVYCICHFQEKNCFFHFDYCSILYLSLCVMISLGWVPLFTLLVAQQYVLI